MKINEVMKETGLTKKAIYYYENEGLIKPQKDPDNNYRNYSEEDVRRLVVINILRRMEVPIKAIGDIINRAVPVRKVLKEQLTHTNRRINMLVQNKLIMNDLIQKDVSEQDFTIDTLKQFNQELGVLSVSSGLAAEELECIFPGMLGKMFAVFYSNFLNVPLDTDEKLAAWQDLIRTLDDMKEDRILEDTQEEYCTDLEDGQSLAESRRLEEFIAGNQDLFHKIDKYIRIINGDSIDYGLIHN
jgi:DNA-binding transcriptional MerR regulator